MHKKRMPDRTSHGATNRSRTDDLILTKDVLYQLSHSSVSNDVIISGFDLFVNSFFKVFYRIRNEAPETELGRDLHPASHRILRMLNIDTGEHI